MALPWWSLPLGLTVITWVAALCAPFRSQGGGYFDIGGAFELIFRLTGAVVATLIFWLVYFIIV